jgi:NAD(P)-dependent dehydrogenase (short-subunit alcohol dehydrogenase family)
MLDKTDKTDKLAVVELDALVLGATRGLGLALTERIANYTTARRIFASYRGSQPGEPLEALADKSDGRLVLLNCDLLSDDSMQALTRQLGHEQAELSLTMHAAGILHEPGLRPEKALSQVNREALLRLFEINSVGPILLAKAIFSFIPKQGISHFAALSAMVGSISDNKLGGWYGYRASKAALNQLLKTLAIEWRRTHPQLCITSIHPGTTDTALSRPFQGNIPDGKLYTAELSAQRILRVVMDGTPADSGRFMNWDGKELPW